MATTQTPAQTTTTAEAAPAKRTGPTKDERVFDIAKQVFTDRRSTKDQKAAMRASLERAIKLDDALKG